MKTVAVISEYNPFHLGHAHQYAEIRKDFGDDTVIVAIMSGNYVQRGTPAILGKFDRAKMAVDAGASLVLELPFPYSAASAEYFASAGVSIANDLGVIDALSFGSECGDVALLSDTADKLSAPDFQKELRHRLKDKEEKSKGYARTLFEVFSKKYGTDFPIKLDLPNNILSISYIRALKKLSSSIEPHTVFRVGTDEDGASETALAGATYLRTLLLSEDPEQALPHVPACLHPLWRQAITAGLAPVSPEALAPILLAHLRTGAGTSRVCAESGDGVLPLLKKAAREACSLEELIRTAATKKYTDARLRRAVLFSYFGVSTSALRQKPLYTQVLAMDERGQSILAKIRKTTDISLLTKAADLHKLSEAAREQAELAYRADSVYALVTPTPQRSDIFLRTAPYRK